MPPPLNPAADRIQRRIVEDARQALDREGACLIQAPTGAGKTRIFSLLGDRDIAAGRKIMILQGRHNLLDQNSRAFKDWTGRDDKWVSAITEGRLDQSGTAVFAMVQTAAAAAERLARYDAVYIDEAHHSKEEAGVYKTVLAALRAKNPDLRICGLTATPFRADGLCLDDRLASAPQITIPYADLVAAGQILRPRTLPLRIETAKGADFLAEAIDRFSEDLGTIDAMGAAAWFEKRRPADYFAQCARQCRHHAGTRSTLAFVYRIEDAEKLSEAFQDVGISAAVIHSALKPREKIDEAIAAYRQGRIQALISVDMIGEGFDVPKTDAVLIARPMTSRAQYFQMIGRAMRASPGKTEPLVLDAGINLRLHGDLATYIVTQKYALARAAQIGDRKIVAREAGGEYSPWSRIQENPPVFYLRGATKGIVAIPLGEDRYRFHYFARDKSGGMVLDREAQPKFEIVDAAKGVDIEAEFLRRNDSYLNAMLLPVGNAADGRTQLDILIDREKDRVLTSALATEEILKTLPILDRRRLMERER